MTVSHAEKIDAMKNNISMYFSFIVLKFEVVRDRRNKGANDRQLRSLRRNGLTCRSPLISLCKVNRKWIFSGVHIVDRKHPIVVVLSFLASFRTLALETERNIQTVVTG